MQDNNNNDDDNNIQSKLEALNAAFYSQGQQQKNVLFKKKQKEDCARHVSEQVTLEEAISKSFFSIRDEVGGIAFYLNYPLLKLYLHPGNYVEIIDSFIGKLSGAISDNIERTGDESASIDIHINLQGFTISAAERYKYVLVYFSQKCNDDLIVFTPHISRVFIYYTPSAMDSIVSIVQFCLQPEILARMHFVDKEQSEDALMRLMN